MKKTITISTAIAYPNAKPHLGHALEFVHADALARYYRLQGYEVLFTTGTDEHGTKIYKTAKEAGMDVMEFIDANVVFFKKMCELYGISYSLFLRTTDVMLSSGAQKLWKKLVEAGDIYKSEYEGLYCYGCENYMLEKDLVEGLCPTHKRAPEKLKEENYFFRLSKYIPEVKKLIERKRLKIVAEFRAGEILNMMKDMGDISFSRPKSVLPWGVTVPGDTDHVMYVWSDALSNYLTGLDYVGEGENYKKFWPTTINMIGKDIMKFHAVLWPAMLMSAGIPLPERLYVHGFITSEGEKMSKSLGNVVDPIEFATQYGADAIRFYLLSQIPTQDDGDFSKLRFVESYNAHLANNIGNLVSRVVAMAEKYFGGSVVKTDSNDMQSVQKLFDEYIDAFEGYDLKMAFEKILDIAMYANKFVDDNKPWEIAKSGDMVKLQHVLYHLLEVIRIVSVMLQPFIPVKAGEMFQSLGLEDVELYDRLFEPRVEYKVVKTAPLFTKIEL